MHLPETVGINPIIEDLAVDGHLFSEQLGAITQLAIDKHGIVICSNISVATRLRYGQTDLGAGLKVALPHMLALGHVQQCAGGERHGVDGHASMRTAPAHGRLAVLVGNHFDAGAPVKTVKLLITGHAIDWHGHIDMTEPAHLLRNGDGFPLELAGQRDVHEIRSADSPAHRQRAGKRPSRINTVLGCFEHFDNFTGPEPIIAIMRFVKFNAYQFAGQGKADEHHAAIDMGHAAALIGVSLDADFSLHRCPFRFCPPRVR